MASRAGKGKVLIRAGRSEGGKPGGGDKAGSTAANRKTRSTEQAALVIGPDWSPGNRQFPLFEDFTP